MVEGPRRAARYASNLWDTAAFRGGPSTIRWREWAPFPYWGGM